MNTVVKEFRAVSHLNRTSSQEYSVQEGGELLYGWPRLAWIKKNPADLQKRFCLFIYLVLDMLCNYKIIWVSWITVCNRIQELPSFFQAFFIRFKNNLPSILALTATQKFLSQEDEHNIGEFGMKIRFTYSFFVLRNSKAWFHLFMATFIQWLLWANPDPRGN